MEAAPYQRIISDIRARIADGRLAPGDRLPSTRQLAKHWGVALATATKAMAMLCQEGLLEARPRSGTFVAARPEPEGEAQPRSGTFLAAPASEARPNSGTFTAARPEPAGEARPSSGTFEAARPEPAGEARPSSGTFTAARPEPEGEAQPGSGTFLAAPAGEARPNSATFAAARPEPAGGAATLAGPGAGRGRPGGPPPRRADDLTRHRIVQAAIEIADAEGLDALSMRGVAAKLRVATMSTYRHVASKDDLVLLMAEAAFGELAPPDPQPEDWRAELEGAARALWTTFRRHPWLAQVTPLTRPLPVANLLEVSERMHRGFAPFGLDAHARLDLLVVIYSHIQGLAMQLERETQAQEATGLSNEEWLDRHAPAMEALAGSGRYPHFTALISEFGEKGYDLELDRIFELSLRTLLDGLALTLDRASGPP